jgi:uncharacterized phiE125 gp8 family phage protein
MSQLLALARVAPEGIQTEPVALSDMKSYLRVDALFTDDDGLISELISAAREECEEQLNRSILESSWVFNLDYWPSWRPNDTAPALPGGMWSIGSLWWDTQRIFIPRPPLISVDLVTYTALDGTTQTLADTGYIVDTSSEPARLLPSYNGYWPPTLQVPNAVTINFTAGYATVPFRLVLAIKMIVAAWYENPSDFSIGGGSATTIPRGVDRILRKFRVSGFDYSVR